MADIEFLKPKYRAVLKQYTDVATAAGVTYNTHFQQRHPEAVRKGHWQAFLVACAGKHILSCDHCKNLLIKIQAHQSQCAPALAVLDIVPPASDALVAVQPGWELTALSQFIPIV